LLGDGGTVGDDGSHGGVAVVMESLLVMMEIMVESVIMDHHWW